MTTVQEIPMRDEVRRILVAAADVVFSDSVPEAFLDQWTDETVILLSSAGPTRTAAPASG